MTTRLATALEAVAALVRDGSVSTITHYEMPGNDIMTVCGSLHPSAAPAAWRPLPSEGWPRYTRAIGGLDIVFVNDGGMGELSAHHLRKLAALDPVQIRFDPGERLILLGGVTVEQLNLVRPEFSQHSIRLGMFSVDDQVLDTGMSALTVTGDQVRGLLRLVADNAQPLGRVAISLDRGESISPLRDGEEGITPGVDREVLARVVEAVAERAAVVMVDVRPRCGVEMQTIAVSSMADLRGMVPALSEIEGFSPLLVSLYAGGDAIVSAGPGVTVRVLRTTDWAGAVLADAAVTGVASV